MLSTRQIGIITFGLSILLAVIVISFYFSVGSLIEMSGCPLDGCPAHQFFPVQTALGLILVGILAIFSLFLIIQEEKVKVHRKVEKKKSEFETLLSFLTDGEEKVIKAVKEQPGIQQNTLRLRTDFSKAKLSMLLTELETRGIIKKVISGKTNKIYLKKNF